MQPAAELRVQLLVLCAGDADASERLAAELTGLAEAISAVVPSTVSVTLALVHDGVELSVAVSAKPATRQPVRSSWAGSLRAAEPGALLIVRAADTHAFRPRPGETHPWLGLGAAGVQVDQHLSAALVEPGASLALALIELQSIQRGLGALLELGYDPLATRGELARRADLAGSTMAVASRALMAAGPAFGRREDR